MRRTFVLGNFLVASEQTPGYRANLADKRGENMFKYLRKAKEDGYFPEVRLKNGEDPVVAIRRTVSEHLRLSQAMPMCIRFGERLFEVCLGGGLLVMAKTVMVMRTMTMLLLMLVTMMLRMVKMLSADGGDMTMVVMMMMMMMVTMIAERTRVMMIVIIVMMMMMMMTMMAMMMITMMMVVVVMVVVMVMLMVMVTVVVKVMEMAMVTVMEMAMVMVTMAFVYLICFSDHEQRDSQSLAKLVVRQVGAHGYALDRALGIKHPVHGGKSDVDEEDGGDQDHRSGLISVQGGVHGDIEVHALMQDLVEGAEPRVASGSLQVDGELSCSVISILAKKPETQQEIHIDIKRGVSATAAQRAAAVAEKDPTLMRFLHEAFQTAVAEVPRCSINFKVVRQQQRQTVQNHLQPKNRRSKMSITVEVGLLSGKTATVKAGLDEEVGALKCRAQIALGVGRGRLVGSSGSVLDTCAPIKQTRLQNGDLLTLHINRVQIQACRLCFAAILADGSVVTWGSDANGGDSSAVQDQLQNVQQIQASACAFAAILADESVVTWGNAAHGGDSSAVQDQLRNVQQIQATHCAFAAILADGSVVTWGSATSGGDSSAVQDQLQNVQQIQASAGAFAAILADGSVVTWGSVAYGGDSSAVQDQLQNVQQIQASAGAFAAILADGSVVTWGGDAYGGDSSAVQDQLKNVQQIQASQSAFVAILADGSVVTWGNAAHGGDSSAVQDLLRHGRFSAAASTCAINVLMPQGVPIVRTPRLAERFIVYLLRFFGTGIGGTLPAGGLARLPRASQISR
ncbi:hypothetical protein AK812_SmicGene7558 [Symbiodinium microadriaticum]|uniref:Uncharacterized protein n=1 Tax=Symbiodinium microadriaticum TaxID=2951 RepID=A0A1Q9EN94_SYMMI|nr:hypothetical protein AK812_SmicGene7558 [Symbiodinium microadriaticum]